MPDFKSLLPKTANCLKKLATRSELASFTFVGGSALALHLNHRLSEDLDFFTWEAALETESLLRLIAAFPESNISNITPNQLDVTLEGVKVTFFANDWAPLKAERSRLSEHLHVATPELLAAMKINTLFLRAKYRDYYDLYVLHKEVFGLGRLYQLAQKKMKTLSVPLFQRALVFIGDIEDESIAHLSPKYDVSLQEIAAHFEEAIKTENGYFP